MHQAVSMQTSLYFISQSKLFLPAPLPAWVAGLPLVPAPPYPGELSVLVFGFGGWYFKRKF